MTMVIVSHEMGFIREAASRILFLADGVIVEEGSPDQIFSDSQQPRTQEFLRAIL
jgi:polar amino acid transport system ATP-binding protein